MSKKRISFLLNLIITLTLFGLFVFLFLKPKYGPQIVYEDESSDQTEETNLDEPLEFIDEEEQTANPSEPDLNPNYGDLTEEQISIADKALGDLLNSQQGITPGDITVNSFEEREFGDASLGCPAEDQMYAQVVTPGYQVILEAGDQEYDYRISEDLENVILCD